MSFTAILPIDFLNILNFPNSRDVDCYNSKQKNHIQTIFSKVCFIAADYLILTVQFTKIALKKHIQTSVKHAECSQGEASSSNRVRPNVKLTLIMHNEILR